MGPSLKWKQHFRWMENWISSSWPLLKCFIGVWGKHVLSQQIRWVGELCTVTWVLCCKQPWSPGSPSSRRLYSWSSGWAHKRRTNWNKQKGNWNSSMWSSQRFEVEMNWVLGQGAGALLSAGAGCRSSDTAAKYFHCLPTVGTSYAWSLPGWPLTPSFPSTDVNSSESRLILPRLLRLELHDAYKHASGLEIWDLDVDRVSFSLGFLPGFLICLSGSWSLLLRDISQRVGQAGQTQLSPNLRFEFLSPATKSPEICMFIHGK